jgi:hypothetical protein
LDNLAAENVLDCALAAAHLFTACSDASLLTKQHRLAVLCAATLREAREGCCGPEALAAAAVSAAVKHLHLMHATADAAGGGSGDATGVVTSMVSLAVRFESILNTHASRTGPHCSSSNTYNFANDARHSVLWLECNSMRYMPSDVVSTMYVHGTGLCGCTTLTLCGYDDMCMHAER